MSSSGSASSGVVALVRQAAAKVAFLVSGAAAGLAIVYIYYYSRQKKVTSNEQKTNEEDKTAAAAAATTPRQNEQTPRRRRAAVEEEQSNSVQLIDNFQANTSPPIVEDSVEESNSAATSSADNLTPIYEFEIPQSLVGLVIGIKGKTVLELEQRSNCKIFIRRTHPLNREGFQMCTIEGPRTDINYCLQLLRRKFPPSRFPELNLSPVLPPPVILSPTTDICSNHTQQLPLAEGGVFSEVVVSSIQDPGHFFLQQPTHPSFPALARLDTFITAMYSQQKGIPELPRPIEEGVLCVAPALGGWFRATTMFYYQEADEVLVKYVDYGGYSRLPASDLKQIRSDFIALPFQANECYMASIQPKRPEE